jgi:hypothetical protein
MVEVDVLLHVDISGVADVAVFDDRLGRPAPSG